MRRRLGAHSFELRNNKPRGPAAARASQLGPSPSRPERRRCLAGVPHTRPAHHPPPTSGPPPTSKELKSNFPKHLRRRGGPFPAPSPHPARPPTTQPVRGAGCARSPPIPRPETLLAPPPRRSPGELAASTDPRHWPGDPR
ncbi:splicing factor, proline- and glutamine-rich-like [Tupaia chinensis]|uniref:splicing factor, proline- and glutamine-rich-like n=1 Tax=Tupaia chinensis TaxID=246437 RepID=UPI0003C92282|nr:splicing factor, proline- and glutamine-rich-like [Tupaia chinensis]